MKSILFRLGLLAMIIFALAGCGGSTGSTGASGTNGASFAVKVGDNSTSPTAEAMAAWKALSPQVTVTSVDMSGAPVVRFTVKDAAGNAIVGLGNKSKSSTATIAGLSNVYFTLAKLVPVTGAPSKWISYNVIRPLTVAELTTVPSTASCNAAKTWCGSYPTYDIQGTLVDNGDGSYQYTFYRDPKQVAAIVAGLTDSVDGLSKKADLDDLTYDASRTHRLGIQIGGAAPGTGSNTPTGTTVLPAVYMANAANVVYDFRPDGGAISNTRDIVKIDSCTDCHKGKALAHSSSRKDPKYCVTCHTDQIRYSFSQEASVDGAGVLNGTTRQTTAVVNGRALGNFPNLIHKMHMGAELIKQGYYFNAHAEGKFNEVKFPQDQRNCTKCHDGAAADVNKRTTEGDNWKNVPSRLACGACHDGIDFATGTGTSLVTRVPGAWTHGVGGVQTDDTQCSTCHTPAKIAEYHVPVTPPNLGSALHVAGGSANTNAAWVASNTNNLPAGAIRVTYDIKSVSREATTLRPQMVFRMLQNGVAVPFNTYSAGVTEEIWNNFMGAPSVYFVFSVPQDGIQAPADFNASASSYLRSLWNGTAINSSAGTLTGPDASGYYTATLTGVTIPDNAVMLTGGLGYSYNLVSTLPLTQINLAAYPVTASPLATCTAPNTPYAGCLTVGMPNQTGGLIVVSPDAQRVASTGAAAGGTGGTYSARRAIVEDARCNKCHQELGVFTAGTFHGAQRNDGTTCSWCHTPNRTSSAWGADSTNFIHGIHAGWDSTGKGVSSGGKNKRVVKFNWHAVSATEGFWDIGYPGVLKNCESCHLPGTYDFSATASANAMANKQYRTVASGTSPLNASISTPTYTNLGGLVFGTTYGAGFSFNAGTGATTAAAATTLVDSPITTVCFSCHDTTLARAHMVGNGGSLYEARSTALVKTEQCMLCHGSGRVADIKAMHEK
jgi:OmcA/MtrC family decaheme c-type cytochrome